MKYRVALPSLPIVLLIVPLIALPLTLVLASAVALRTPAPRPISAPIPQDEAPPPRHYVSLKTPINVSLPDGGLRLKIELALALHADESRGLEERFEKRPEEVQTGLADAVLRAAEKLGPDVTPDVLRQDLPDVLRATLNTRLEDLGEAPAVLEVLITEWALAP